MDVLEVRRVEVGDQQMLRSLSSVVPNAFAAPCYTCATQRGRRRTATSGGRRATLSCTSFATSSSEKAIPRPSPTSYCGRTPPALRPAIHVGGR
jgi:hypothetical protein